MTEPHDRLLAAAYARQPAPESGHPDEEAWVRLAAHELPPAETQALADHLARCVECTRIYRALAHLEEGARTFDPAVPARPRSAGRWNVLALAGGVAAAAVVAWVVVRPLPPPVIPPPTQELRGGSAAPVPMRPLGTQTTRPAVFEWKPTEGARAYRVRLLDAKGDMIWSSGEVKGTTVALPADVALRPGRHYWQVVAVLADGGGISASPMADFDVPR
jgi:hypothetical protein